MNNLFENNGAKFSDCGKHRLLLWRLWDDKKPFLMFIGLNPSTANAESDDNTIRKIKAIATSNGFGGVYMTNLFTFISTDPKKLNITDGNHPDADFYLCTTANNAEKVICAWGNFEVLGRDKEVRSLLFDERLYALHINKNGSPKHPLYCKNDSPIIDFKS